MLKYKSKLEGGLSIILILEHIIPTYLQDISFETPQHVRTQHFMEFLNLILLWNVSKLILEGCQIIKFLSAEKIKQMKQFFQVIL